MTETPKIYDPFTDLMSAESKLIAYRERAKILLGKEYGEYGSYFTHEITTTAKMLYELEKEI